MARQPRLDLPGIPQHVVQRGNNRLPCFLDDDDRQRYAQWLRAAMGDAGCALHAYVLMDNHVHLLVTPSQVGAITRMMQDLGRRYVGWFNARHERTGTLWEGRFKACLVDSENYILRCYRYIDLNPVRARITADPAQFAWSSCAAHLGRRRDPLLTPHPAFTGLGGSPASRRAVYGDLLQQGMAADDLAEIRTYLKQQRVLGHDAFQSMVEAKTRRFASVRSVGRPRKKRSGSIS